MLMSKNVNNDVSKDSPIDWLSQHSILIWKLMSSGEAKRPIMFSENSVPFSPFFSPLFSNQAHKVVPVKLTGRTRGYQVFFIEVHVLHNFVPRVNLRAGYVSSKFERYSDSLQNRRRF